MFILANFTVALVGTNIEKRDMQFVTPKLTTSSLCNNIVETIYNLFKDKPLINHEASGGSYQKYHIHTLSGIIPGVGLFHNHKLIWLEWYPDLEYI